MTTTQSFVDILTKLNFKKKEMTTTTNLSLTIKTLMGEICYVGIDSHAHVVDLKEILERRLDVPTDQQCLIFKGGHLKNGLTFHNYGIVSGDTIHMVLALGPVRNYRIPVN